MNGTVLPRSVVGPRLSPASSLRAGDVLGARYRLEALRANEPAARRPGSSFEVHAVDTKDGSPALVQVMTGASDETDAVGVRILAAARRVAVLTSEHVARVLDAGVTEDGHPYVVTEDSKDETLSAYLARERSLPTETAVDIALDVCDALAEAHARGLLHGSLGSDAIRLSLEGGKPVRVKVFGIGTQHATLALRRPEEMPVRAPEQLVPNAAIDVRTDVWAVGVLLYDMLAGASPFTLDSPSTANLSLLLDEPPQLAGIPDKLADIVDACIAKNPALRPLSIAHLAEELALFASRPLEAVGRASAFEEHPPESSPTIVVRRYEALTQEKVAAGIAAEPSRPSLARGIAALHADGAALVAEPPSVPVVTAPPIAPPASPDPSIAPDPRMFAAPAPKPASVPPPAVSRTIPPPHVMPMAMASEPTWAERLRAPALAFAGAALTCVVGFAAMHALRGTPAPAHAAAETPAHVEAPPSPEAARETEPAPTEAPEPEATTIAASALPDSLPDVAPARPRAASKRRATKPAPARAPASATATAQTTTAPATPTAKPEPKASDDDDLRSFLDDRR